MERSLPVIHSLAIRCLCFVRNGTTRGLHRAGTPLNTFNTLISLPPSRTAKCLREPGKHWKVPLHDISVTLFSASLPAERAEPRHMAHLRAAAALAQDEGRGRTPEDQSESSGPALSSSIGLKSRQSRRTKPS